MNVVRLPLQFYLDRVERDIERVRRAIDAMRTAAGLLPHRIGVGIDHDMAAAVEEVVARRAVVDPMMRAMAEAYPDYLPDYVRLFSGGTTNSLVRGDRSPGVRGPSSLDCAPGAPAPGPFLDGAA